MIDNISSYSVKNFIPFGDEVYFRLFERHFEKWWPVHPLMLLLGVIILVLAWMGKSRALAVALAVPIVFCAVTFHFQFYAFLALDAERKLTGVEYLGMSPDPTICFALGIFLMSKRPLWFLLLFPIPFLWAAATAGTIDALEAPMAMTLPAVSAAAFIAAIAWKWLLPRE